MIVSAVTEAAFVERRRPDWNELEALVAKAARAGLGKLAHGDVARISPLYRDLCGDFARARAARYSAPLVDYLQGLTAAAHTLMYGRRLGGRARVRGRTAADVWDGISAFPRAVRAHKTAMLLAAFLFFGPLLGGFLGALHDPTFAFRVAPESMLRPLTEAYAKGFADGRAVGEDALMAGFYVNNNVGIALRCFALGIFGGIGSAFYLVQNGVSIGAIFGYIVAQGAGTNFITFVVGHGSLELGAIVLAGGSGLSLGWSVVAPGPLTRVASLQSVARDVFVIVCGAAVMLLMAAAVEGFWSGSSIPRIVKYATGAALFVLVMSFLILGGRRRGPRSVAA